MIRRTGVVTGWFESGLRHRPAALAAPTGRAPPLRTTARQHGRRQVGCVYGFSLGPSAGGHTNDDGTHEECGMSRVVGRVDSRSGRSLSARGPRRSAERRSYTGERPVGIRRRPAVVALKQRVALPAKGDTRVRSTHPTRAGSPAEPPS